MNSRFCVHLDEYGALFQLTEASYGQCVNLMDQIIAGNGEDGLQGLLVESLQSWLKDNQELRDMFEDLAALNKVILPKKAVLASHCSVCKMKIPRLVFTEWIFNEDGTVSFRGQDLPVTSPEIQPVG